MASSNVTNFFQNHQKILFLVAFRIYDVDRDGFISNGELFTVRSFAFSKKSNP
jgi:Ca2+-binding EF-hand superfamily protein